jgi:5-methylcytosine-specific restriction endonuclease McrA
MTIMAKIMESVTIFPAIFPVTIFPQKFGRIVTKEFVINMKKKIPGDQNERTDEGKSEQFKSLKVALNKHNLREAIRLISNSIGVNGEDENSNSPLHYAVIWNEPKFVEFLLENAADANAANVKGVTPLHFACKQGSLKIAQLLIEFGANINIKDKSGKRPRKDVSYTAYMATRRWRMTRIKAIADSGHKCSCCGSSSDLNVHHRNYERLGNENLPEDLKVLCRKCHEKRHEIEKKLEFAKIKRHLQDLKDKKKVRRPL